MKNILLLLMSTAFILSVVGCSGKEPFKVQIPKKSAGLVYVYIAENTYIDDTFRIHSYDVTINKRATENSVKIGEYLKFDIKPGKVSFALVLGGMDINTIKLDVKEGETYYLRGRSTSSNFEGFEFEEMTKNKGSEEIIKCVMANEYIDTNSMANALFNSDDNQTNNAQISEDKTATAATKDSIPVNKSEAIKSPSVASSSTKLDDIKEAYNMKKEGLLTNEEFKAMKAEILAK